MAIYDLGSLKDSLQLDPGTSFPTFLGQVMWGPVLAEADDAAYPAAHLACFKAQHTDDLHEEMRTLKEILKLSSNNPKRKAWASRKISELEQDIASLAAEHSSERSSSTRRPREEQVEESAESDARRPRTTAPEGSAMPPPPPMLPRSAAPAFAAPAPSRAAAPAPAPAPAPRAAPPRAAPPAPAPPVAASSSTLGGSRLPTAEDELLLPPSASQQPQQQHVDEDEEDDMQMSQASHAGGPGYDEQYRCPTCLRLLVEPVSGPCGHHFCKHCFYPSVKAAGSASTPKCPLCRDVIPLERCDPAVDAALWCKLQSLYPDMVRRRMSELSASTSASNHAPTNAGAASAAPPGGDSLARDRLHALMARHMHALRANDREYEEKLLVELARPLHEVARCKCVVPNGDGRGYVMVRRTAAYSTQGNNGRSYYRCPFHPGKAAGYPKCAEFRWD